MPIDWTTFENNLTSFFGDHRAVDEADAAKFIADEYLIAITAGQDAVWGTQYLNGTIDLFKDTLETGFLAGTGMQAEDPTFLYTHVNNAVLAFWPTVTFALLTTPALLAATVATLTTNLVTSPGTMAPFVVPNSDNANDFAKTLSTALQQHASTVVGQVIGVTSTVPPAPFTAPWTGVL